LAASRVHFVHDTNLAVQYPNCYVSHVFETSEQETLVMYKF
jgi:hypothetical protein